VGVVIVRTKAKSIGDEGGCEVRSQIVSGKICIWPRIDDSILGDQALPILEIIPKGVFYDFNNKYPFLNPQAGGAAEHVCPAKIDPDK